MTDWPDWTGRAVAIVASGPSARAAGVDRLKGLMPVLAIKRSWELAPFAEAVYCCDGAWWRSVNGLPEFGGLKLSYEPAACDAYRLKRVFIPQKLSNALAFEEVGVVGAGGNSGFQALNLAAQWGATRILGVGFDCHDRGGPHWYGRNTAMNMTNPDEDNFRRWRLAFDGAAKDLNERGIEFVNASPTSTLKAFRRLTIEETLCEWGLA